MHCFKLMSKMAIMAVMFLVITAVSAFSTPINSYWQLGNPNVNLGTYTNDSDTVTSLFDQILYYANYNTTQYDTDNNEFLSVGDVYLTDGHVLATNLSPVNGNDTEGLSVDYEFTFVLTDLVGVVESILTDSTNDVVVNRYIGGTINMYINADLEADYNQYSTVATDNTVDLSDDIGFDTGILVATIENIHGTGSSTFTSGSVMSTDPQFKSGSHDISGTFTYLLNDFWYDENDDDLLEKLVNLSWLVGSADGNVDRVHQEFTDHGESASTDHGPVLYTIDSDSNASFELTAVPEPATCLLLGCGLLSLSGVSRKRFKK